MGRELELPYVPIDPGIDQSEKMLAYLDALGDEHGDHDPEAKVYRLLLWAGGHRPNGNIGKITPRRLAEICRWRGDPELWHQALVAGGWLVDNGEGGWAVDGWIDAGGRVLVERERFREQARLRQKRKRCREGGHRDPGCDCLGPEADAARESRDVTPQSRDVTVGYALEPEGEGEPEGEEKKGGAAAAIDSVAALEVAAGVAGLAAGNLKPKVIAKARAIIDAGPIQPHEWEHALKELGGQDPPIESKYRLSWVLGAVDLERTKAEREARRPRAGPAPPRRSDSAFRDVTERLEREWVNDGQTRVPGGDDPPAGLLPPAGQ